MINKIVVKEFKNLDSISTESESLEELRKGLDDKHSLVKVYATPVNPLDIQKIQGNIFSVKCPFTPGSEGSGVIEESSHSEWIGKKVSFCATNGSWREMCLVHDDNLIILQDDTNLDSASCGFINPFTALGLIETAILKHKAQGIVNLAATSALGRMIKDIAKERGLKCLNVIRGDSQRVEEIKTLYSN